MSADENNPLGREYTEKEVAAGIRVGVARREKKFSSYPETEVVTSGQMIYATGDYWPKHARKMAKDWATVAEAMEREWHNKETSNAQV